ncbi:MAG: 3-oxoacyl-[acyl-carrier-protein] reductase, partial [Acidobacteriota bacterium]
MEDYMANKTAFITGASRGIGRACAIALAQAGNRVALAARDMAKLEEVANEVRALGAEAHVVA